MSTFYKAVTSNDSRYIERHPSTGPHLGVDLSFVTQVGVVLCPVHSGYDFGLETRWNSWNLQDVAALRSGIH
jgi:hypothetical protein